MKYKKFAVFSILFSILALASFYPSASIAQSSDSSFNPIQNSVDSIDNILNLGDRSIPDIIFSLITILLNFVGIILVVIIIYAGFLWMLSGGKDEGASKAKKTLFNAIIGVVIILSANAIVRFVFSTLMASTGSGQDPIL